MQYKRLKKLITIVQSKDPKIEDSISMPLSTFMSILRAAAGASPLFDEAHYLTTRPDVADAIKKGSMASARTHFARTGYFEDLLPGKIAVDEGFYLESNPDLAAAFRKQLIEDPQQHFDSRGFAEGRLPSKNFSIWEAH